MLHPILGGNPSPPSPCGDPASPSRFHQLGSIAEQDTASRSRSRSRSRSITARIRAEQLQVLQPGTVEGHAAARERGSALGGREGETSLCHSQPGEQSRAGHSQGRTPTHTSHVSTASVVKEGGAPLSPVPLLRPACPADIDALPPRSRMIAPSVDSAQQTT